MTLTDELLCRDIGRSVLEYYKIMEIDYNQIVQTNALNALGEIKEIILNVMLDDFMKVDKIVDVFIKYAIDKGSCHDFSRRDKREKNLPQSLRERSLKRKPSLRQRFLLILPPF